MFNPSIKRVMDVTEVVRGWAKGLYVNNGMAFFHVPNRPIDDGNGCRFEMGLPNGNQEWRPVLEVTLGVPE